MAWNWGNGIYVLAIGSVYGACGEGIIESEVD